MEHKIANLKNELADLNTKLQDPAIFSDPSYPKLAKRQNFLESTVKLDQDIKEQNEQLSQAQELSSQGGELAELADIEIEELNTSLAQLNAELEEALTPKDPNDERDCIIEIRAGAGGDESSLFAGELLRI